MLCGNPDLIKGRYVSQTGTFAQVGKQKDGIKAHISLPWQTIPECWVAENLNGLASIILFAVCCVGYHGNG